jgi:hypothetical protein
MTNVNDPTRHGEANPLDKKDKVEPTEFFFGCWVTKEEFIGALNGLIDGRAQFVEEEHCDGRLHLSIAFEE